MKILDITGNPFSRYLNNGKTHEAIFSAFQKTQLCQLYVRPVSKELIDFDYCSSYYCVSDWDVLNKLSMRSKVCGGVVSGNTTKAQDESLRYTNGNIKKAGSRTGIAGILRDLLWSTGVWKNKNLKSWLQNQNPDIIFIDGGGDSYMYNIALFASSFLNIPLVYYVTDDYVIYPMTKSVAQKFHHKSVVKKITEVVTKSLYCYAIGETMADEYSKYFKKPFDYVMNAIDILPYQEKKEVTSDVKISYFGSLGLNRDKIISHLGDISRGLFSIQVFAFHITEEQQTLLNNSGVKYMGALKSDKIDEAMYDSDILLHVESDDKESRAFTKLAISTKIPEYLMHSRMILGYGPSEVASMKLLSKNDIGIVIDSDLPVEIQQDKLRQTLSANFRKIYSRRGHQYAVEHFDKVKIGERIKETFNSILNY